MTLNHQTDFSILTTTLLSRSADETAMIGQQLAPILEAGMVCALFGNLGSGKTVLVKGICRGLDVQEEVTSPSFTIMNIYRGRLPVFHFDFYRLARNANWDELGLAEYFYADALALIEWPDRLADDLPANAVRIFIQRIRPVCVETENQRQIKIVGLTAATTTLTHYSLAQQIG